MLTSLTLARSFYLKSRDELFQLFPTAFGAFRLPGIVLSNAKNESEFLAAFRASVFISGHLLSPLFAVARLQAVRVVLLFI